MTHEEIIDALGGTGKVATALKLSAPTVSVWKKRGISTSARWPIARLAKAAGVPLPADFLVEL